MDEVPTTIPAGFCATCGTTLTVGPFCPGCGQQRDHEEVESPFPRHDAATQRAAETVRDSYDPPVAPAFAPEPPVHGGWPAAPQPPAPTAKRSNALLVGLALALLAGAAVAVVVVLALSGGGHSKPRFSQQVQDAFTPVDSANRDLSSALADLRTGHPGSAQRAADRAQNATSTAQGTLAALGTPAGSQQLASQTRQALDRESTYLRAVRTTLDHPSNAGAAQLQELAGNLTSALEAAGAPLAGDAQNVQGADTLTSWATRTRRTSLRKGRATGGQTTATAPAPVGPYAGQRDCGGGLHAGPRTSCDFAANVRSAYTAAPGEAATVEVFSPVTGQTYTMDCSLAGSGVTCSGGNDASVSW
jgi:hypothetical protein